MLSLRGGDFLFESGEDLSIGYADHDADAVQLYLRGELQLPRRHAPRPRSRSLSYFVGVQGRTWVIASVVPSENPTSPSV